MKPPLSLEKHLKILELMNSPEFKKMMMNAAESLDNILLDAINQKGDRPSPNPPEH